MRPQRITNYVLGLALAAGSAQSTTITTFNDASAWTQASGDALITTEQFKDPTRIQGFTLTSDVGFFADGSWNDIVSSGESALNRSIWETTIEFQTAVQGFGGTWDLRPAGYGTGIRVTLFAGTEELGRTELDGHSGSFWGLMSDARFDRLVLTAGSQRGVQETYRLDDLTFASADDRNLSPVPIPAAIWLFVSGLLGLAGISRIRQSAQTS